jgi:plastocyanin
MHTIRPLGIPLRTRLLLLVLAVTVTGCSGGNDASSDQAGSPAVAPLDSTAHLHVIRVTDDMRFEPEDLTVPAGDTVVWLNEGTLLHTATDEPGRAGVPENNVLPAGAETWDSGLLDSRGAYRLVPTVPGDYTYLCTIHEAAGMVGRIRVVPKSAS